MTKVTTPTITTRVSVEAMVNPEYGSSYRGYDSTLSGIWIEPHPTYGWPQMKFKVVGDQDITITLFDHDLKTLIKALAAYL